MCNKCSKFYEKRVDTMKGWSGYCRDCVSKVITIKGKYRKRKTCLGCNKVSKYIKESNYCKACGSGNQSRGEKHWNWKGGITEKDKYLRSKFLKNTHPKVLVRDDYTCQICFTRGNYLQVDHIKSWADYPELRFDMDNCRTLCMACHYYVTFKRKMPQGTIWGHNLSRRIVS